MLRTATQASHFTVRQYTGRLFRSVMPRVLRSLPIWLCLATAAGFLLTIDRIPIVWTDEVIYASIARAMQLRVDGVPTVLDGAPAIDHVGFYGPIYFALAARLFDVFGVSMTTFRMLGVLGAFAAAAAGMWLARLLGSGSTRAWWTAAIILLTPEVGYTATGGRMDTVALAWSMAALACYARALRDARPAWSAAAGACLAGAALTAPRVYPFVAIALVVGAIAAVRHGPPVVALDVRRASPWVLWASAAAACGAVLSAWGTVSHGSPWEWARFLWFIASREGVEVAIAEGAARRWSFAGWYVLTSIAAVAGLIGLMRWRNRDDMNPAIAFVVATAALNFAATLWILNLTFAVGSYFAVPLMAVVVAAFPSELTRRRRAIAVTALTGVVAAMLAVRVVRTARVAATWAERDAAPIARFVRAHVPAGSLVYGPDFFYFYAVEQAGSRYLSASRVSGAGWARLVPQREVRHPLDPARPRYVIWPIDTALVEAQPAWLQCAEARLVARFEARDSTSALARLSRPEGALPETYVSSVLTSLPSSCEGPGA